ncbi:glycoside hydrolase family 95 protein [Kribbella sp. CA-253562]|uniref:glycoside hydrolase family 95 protein n=1 Tax=Kribbella sp. CA-253562 TaxID=3239942 RepID=UPI003D91E036
MLTREVVQRDLTGNQPAGRLWYSHPATRWFEALPVGNGNIGGMVYSGADAERVRLSAATAWSGAPGDSDVSSTALKYLPQIRRLLLSGEYAEAQALADQHLPGRPSSFGTNVPLPELVVEHRGDGEVSGYERSLELDEAIVRSRFVKRGVSFEREVFATNVAGVLVAQTRSSAPVEHTVGFSEDAIPAEVTTDGETLVLRGHAYESLHSNGKVGSTVEIHAKVLTDGSIEAGEDRLTVNGATTVTVIVAVGTDWRGADPAAQARALLADLPEYDVLKQQHRDDHAGLMGRVGLELGASDGAVRELPTDERRALFAKGGDDPELVALYFQYGRYLTIAGSRADSPLPLALQGLWNDGRASGGPWTNDFHLDINTQQNYWAAEITNLGECHQPLFGLIDGLRASGSKTAAEMYGAPGWVSHTVSNAWSYTAPGWGLGWGLHVTSGIWISLQLWEHFEYHRDLGFLADRAYPVLKDAAQFFLAYLTEDPDTGYLLSGPSDSPENWYLTPDGEKCSISLGNTTDRVLIEALFRVCTEASELLGVDDDFRAQLEAARAKLPPFRIGKHGQLQEWLHDFDEAEPNHRHTSHLIALYPERQITPRTTPELARAAEVIIERRQGADGWEQTEWVEANLIAFYARLQKGDLAVQHIRQLIADASEDNLLSYSVAGIAGVDENIYAFDGNSGGTGAMAELFVQSTGTEIELLPALPAAWPTGSITGLRARGGYTVDLTWADGQFVSADLTAAATSTPQKVRVGDELIDLDLGPGETARIEARR